MVNGQSSDRFRPHCGLRQGDPLSPLLFLFCMDILSRMMSLQEDLGNFKGLRLSRRSPSISHLFFADDAMLFFKIDNQSCQCLVDTLSRFCAISGQRLNLGKYFMKMSPNTAQVDRQTFKEILKVSPVEWFGHHLFRLITRKDDQAIIVSSLTKVVQKLAGWNSLLLSSS